MPPSLVSPPLTESPVQEVSATSTMCLSGIGELDRTDRTAWERLLDEDRHAGIGTHPLLVNLRSDARLLRLINDTGEWRAVAALLPELFRIGLHLLPGTCGPLPGLRLAGDHIVARDHQSDTDVIIAAIADELTASGGQLLEFEDVPQDSALWRGLWRLQRCGFHVCTPLPPQPHRRLSLPPTADAYWSSFSAKTRSQMRRRRRKLNTSLRRFTHPDDVDEFLDVGNAVSLKTWQWHKNKLALANDEATRTFHRQLAEMGLWRAYLLYTGDVPVAYADGCQSAEVFYYRQPGYDQSFAKAGPGRVLLACLVDDLYEHNTPRTLDFGPGDMPYKAEFANQHTMNATVWVLPPGVRSWKIAQSLQWKQRLHRSARAVLTRLGLFERLRAISRRGRATAGEDARS